MPNVTSRAFAGASDLAALRELWLLCRATEDQDPWPALYVLDCMLQASPQGNPDVQLWEDADQHLQACGILWDAGVLLFCIHPRAQTGAVQATILDWAIQRCVELARHSSELSMLAVPVRSDDSALQVLLQRQGFSAAEWQTLRMQYRFPAQRPVAALPAGFVIRPLAGEAELGRLLALEHSAKPGSEQSLAERLALMQAPCYRPALDLVVEAAEQQLAGFCLGSLCVAENTRLAQPSGWIEVLAVHPHYRRLGLGRALLYCTLEHLHEAGVRLVWLGTGSWNSAAQRLFASCGFQTLYRIAWYFREL